ncbi:MAG: hypothetical protein AB7O04_06295 [Hyphomonadaceae bacterium]
MWVRFLSDYLYTPSKRRQVTIEYKTGARCSVKRECGQAAIAAGAAMEIPTPASRHYDDALSRP